MYLQRIVRASLALLVAGGLALAQGPLPDEAVAALNRGESLMAEALATYPAQYPDRPLWQQAFAEGRRAEALAPGHLEPIRFLAEAYARSNWPGPAWTAWARYLAGGGTMDDEARDLFAIVGKELGYGAYARGDAAAALDFYTRVTDVVADDTESRVWVGRILIETVRPNEAVPFWRSVVDLDPTDARAAYFLQLALDQATWGTRAVDLFRAGVALHEQGEANAAGERFARATVANPTYPEAWAWLGRIAFEAGDYVAARNAYANASGLAPDDATYRYFLAESIARSAGD